MQKIFMDESSDLGFGVGSAYMILAFIPPCNGKALNKTGKKSNLNSHYSYSASKVPESKPILLFHLRLLFFPFQAKHANEPSP